MRSIFSASILASLGLMALSAESAESSTQLVASSDFPGGSASVEGIDQQTRTIRLTPTEHQDRGWVCWWYFKVTGIEPGETVILDVGRGVWATPDRAAFSLDNRTWKHTPKGKREQDRIVYEVKVDADDAWFAWGPPFVPEDALRLAEDAVKRSPHATAFELCKSREGRSVPALRVSETGVPDDERVGIWVQARQHAWESGSSWVCKGFVDWLLSDDPRAAALRQRSAITIVPIMDIDNVARGAGGKNQVPHDHNRDWTDAPYFRSVEAAQTEIARLDAAGRFDLFIDLHNPAANDREPFFFVRERERLPEIGQMNLVRFLAVAKDEITGDLRFTGRIRESGPTYDPQWQAISKNWVNTHCREHVVAVCLESSWNTPHSTTEGYEEVGRGLGRAVAGYFDSSQERQNETPGIGD